MPSHLNVLTKEDKGALIDALNNQNMEEASGIILDAYKLFIGEIDKTVIRAKRLNKQPEVNLGQFARELNDVYNSIEPEAQPYFSSVMKTVINVKDAHRKVCIDAVKGILETFGDLKKQEIHADTPLSSLLQVKESAEKICGVDCNDDTTVGELYNKRREMIRNTREGAFAKAVGSVMDKLSSHPSDQDYKDFVRQMINLQALGTIQTSITDKVKEQQEKALSQGIPEGYADAIQKEVVSSNQYALTQLANAAKEKLLGKGSSPKDELVKSINTNLASMTMSVDLAERGFTAAQLDSIDSIQRKVERTKGKRGNIGALTDTIDYIFEEIKSIFTHLFGSESSKIVDGVKADFRKEMRHHVMHNLGQNLEKDFEVLGKMCEKLKNAVEFGAIKQESTKHRDKHTKLPEKINVSEITHRA